MNTYHRVHTSSGSLPAALFIRVLAKFVYVLQKLKEQQVGEVLTYTVLANTERRGSPRSTEEASPPNRMMILSFSCFLSFFKNKIINTNTICQTIFFKLNRSGLIRAGHATTYQGFRDKQKHGKFQPLETATTCWGGGGES